MGNLVTGMNTGIRATGANQIHRVVCHLRDRPGKLALHRADARLLILPAMKSPAIVLKGERDTPCPDTTVGCQWLRCKKQ